MFCFCSAVLFAQPANDNCESAANLGSVPACPDQVFTNIGADATIFGNSDLPSCFNGQTTQRDVWFSFTTPDDLVNISITVSGVEDGPNAQALINPQFIVYDGFCDGELEEVGFCARAPNGDQQIQAVFSGLEPATTYFLRVNDYSATASPNSGDFSVCIEESAIPINMGEETGSVACRGTLFDSGGPDGNYSDFEETSFTICPEIPGCIEIELLEFAIETFDPSGVPGLNGDQLLFYEGEGTGGPLLAAISGFKADGEPIRVQSTATCVTVVMSSDVFINFGGFQLQWNCQADCQSSSSIANPTPVASLPFSGTYSTCDGAATFAASPCTGDGFLAGPDYVFVYDSPGNVCVDISVGGNAAEGTGLLVLNGPPNEDETLCIARSSRGSIPQANLQEPGRYYIVVANANNCSDFDISISEAECSISPSLQDALCNPLNGCVDEEGIPSVFLFEDGFQDMEITDANRGCWEGFGDEPDFVWFTMQARSDGPFGFILQSGDNVSDIDFNVWGPFTAEQVCERPSEVVNFITNNQPIRSSYAPSPGGLTGLTDVHPNFGFPIRDEYDCGEVVGSGGDDFVRPIDARTDEVYVVLMNDWGNNIEEGGILIDWNPSDPPVIGPIIPELISNVDTALCQGDSIQIVLENGIDAIQWLNDTTTLSCVDCLTPIATPATTTTYRALIDGVCFKDTIEVTIDVLELALGPDIDLCFGAEFELVAGKDYPNATYEWTVPDGIQLSCTDCPAPTVTASQTGDFTLSVRLSGSNCELTDEIVLSVGPEDQPAPVYSISDNMQICLGDSVRIGGPDQGNTYNWTSKPAGFISAEANPLVRPAVTTTYILEVSNVECSFPTRDSLTIEVGERPIIKLVEDTTACQGDTLILSLNSMEENVEYTWSGPGLNAPNSEPMLAIGMDSPGMQTYTLRAERMGCLVEASVGVDVTQIELSIGMDTLLLCKGDTQLVQLRLLPIDAEVQWTPSDYVEQVTEEVYAVYPELGGTYNVQAVNGACSLTDSVYIAVDTLPVNLAIMPLDTTICEGETIILESAIYEPRDFPNIEFMWIPALGQQTPDSLYNLVATPDTTVIYSRVTTNGACVDTTVANVTVNKIAEISIIPPDTTLCQGEIIDLRVQIPEGKTMEEIMWSPESGLSCTDCLTPTAFPPSRITYNVQGKIDDCPVSASATIEVLPAPSVNLIGNTAICIGESIQLNSLADPFTTYEWSSPDDPSFSSTEPLLIVSPAQTTTYMLTALRGECEEITGSATINVVQNVSLSVTAPDEICGGDALSLSAQVSPDVGVGETYTWFYNGQTATGPSVSISGLMEQTTFTLVYENPCQTLEESFTVDVKESVRITSMAVDPPQYLTEGVPLGQSVIILAETNPVDPAGSSFAWTANGEPVTGNGLTLTHTPTDEQTTYELTITTSSGCISTASITVNTLIPSFDVPNAFTPNGDNTNDFFNVVTVEDAIFDVIDFKVWNRWGQLVYNNENPSQGWDGKHNGSLAPSDVYIYRITVRLPNGEEQTFEGDVVLIR